MRDLALSIDFGTNGVRALLYDRKGVEICRKEKKYTGYYSLKKDWVEAPAEMFWSDMCCVLKALFLEDANDANRIIGITVACQRDTGTIVDEHGEALRDFIIWQDRRLLDQPIPTPSPWRQIFKFVGKEGFVESFNVGAHVHWIKVNEPELWEKSAYYVLLSGYIYGKLIGRTLECDSDIAAHLPFDYKKRRWCKSNQILSQIIQVEPEKLPPVISSCQKLGEITEEASLQTGLPAGLPVIGSGTDKGCETIGAGCVEDSVASVSLGTQATVETTTKKYYELVSFYPPFPSVIPDAYNPEITVYCGWHMANWYIDHYLELERKECGNDLNALYQLINEKVQTVPPGSEGLILHPYWGMESFKPEARGSIIGFTEGNTKYHVLRAIVEGLGYALLEGMETIEKKSGRKIKQVALSGGGAKADAVCQILADIWNRPTYRVQTTATTGLGAAMAVFTTMGVFDSLEKAKEAMVHYTRIFDPNPENVELYARIFRNIYCKAYKRYKPLYREMLKIHY